MYPLDRIGDALADEGPLAARVAERHPNIEHVIVRNGAESPLDRLEQYHFLYERPFMNLCNGVWLAAIFDEARRRRHSVMLVGNVGNFTISYDGMAVLTRMLRRGQLWRLIRHAYLMRGHGVRLRTTGAHVFGPFLPAQLWRLLMRGRGKDLRLAEYTAIKKTASARFGVAALGAQRGVDFGYRPRSDPVETRLWGITRTDHGNYNKGALAGWGLDLRDPTADRTLVEFCLRIPSEQFIADGRPRSLARRSFVDRLPHEVLVEYRRGRQAVDWHEGLGAANGVLREELEALTRCASAVEMLEIEKMSRMTAEWPQEADWNGPGCISRYRLALLRGISGGHFLRRAAGTN